MSIARGGIKRNWGTPNGNVGAAECGAAVKGNAYGLGVEPVGRALWDAGCRSFFVARPKECEELRLVLPEAVIYVYDNNSRDRTCAIAAAAGAIVRHEPQQGKGRVMLRMFSAVDAEGFVTVDGDATYQAARPPAPSPPRPPWFPCWLPPLRPTK